MSNFKSGDVLSYIPATGNHCRQGTAIVRPDGRIVDTYWDEKGQHGNYILTPGEINGANLKFNVGDYEEIGTIGHCRPSDKEKWEEYHPKDRQIIGSQHQWCAVLYVRKGSSPDMGTKIENARRAVTDAEAKVRNAEWHLSRCRQELEALEVVI